jgi:Ala-tRNA(Pro) deacylase
MLAPRLKTFLDGNHVPYATLQHPIAFTAQGVAAVTHVHGRELAKTVVIRADGRFVLAVLPAPGRVDLKRFREVVGADLVSLATEVEFQGLFPGCEPGAMPPFGNLYGLPVFVDQKLTLDRTIVFNAGTHSEAIRMEYADFERLVQPKVAAFARG